jgi:hypothetical protein
MKKFLSLAVLLASVTSFTTTGFAGKGLTSDTDSSSSSPTTETSSEPAPSSSSTAPTSGTAPAAPSTVYTPTAQQVEDYYRAKYGSAPSTEGSTSSANGMKQQGRSSFQNWESQQNENFMPGFGFSSQNSPESHKGHHHHHHHHKDKQESNTNEGKRGNNNRSPR